MVRTETPVCDFGQPAPDFRLPGTDGKTYSLKDVRGPNGLLVMFICNHCPYVKAVHERIVRDVSDLKQYGIGAVAISFKLVAANGSINGRCDVSISRIDHFEKLLHGTLYK